MAFSELSTLIFYFDAHNIMGPLFFLQLLLVFTLAVIATDGQTNDQQKSPFTTINQIPLYVNDDPIGVTDEDDLVFKRDQMISVPENKVNNGQREKLKELIRDLNKNNHNKDEEYVPWTKNGFPDVNNGLRTYKDLVPVPENFSSKQTTTTEEQIPFTYVIENWDIEESATSMNNVSPSDKQFEERVPVSTTEIPTF